MNEEQKLKDKLFELRKDIAKLKANASVRAELREEQTRQKNAEKRKDFITEQKQKTTIDETESEKVIKFIKQENTLYGVAFVLFVIGLFILLK